VPVAQVGIVRIPARRNELEPDGVAAVKRAR
jgi:hypothetical protein